MSDLNLPQPILQRRSVSESESEWMNSATDHQRYPELLIPPGRTESQPSIAELRTNEESTYNRTRTNLHPLTLLSEVRIGKFLERYRKLKTEIESWEQDLKTLVVSPDEINEQFDSLTKITDDLSKEALRANVELSMCGQICYFKTILKQIRRTALTDPRIQWNDNSPLLGLNGDIRNREDIQIRNTVSGSRSDVLNPCELDITYPFFQNVRVRNTISGSRSNIDKPSDYSRDRVFESDRIGSDFSALEQSRNVHDQPVSNLMNIEFTDEPGFVDPRDLARRKFQEDLQKSKSIPLGPEDLTKPNSSIGGAESDDTQTENLADVEFSRSMILMLELLNDNWSTTMKTLYTNQEDRVERLEQGFAAVISSNRRIESLKLRTQVKILLFRKLKTFCLTYVQKFKQPL